MAGRASLLGRSHWWSHWRSNWMIGFMDQIYGRPAFSGYRERLEFTRIHLQNGQSESGFTGMA